MASKTGTAARVIVMKPSEKSNTNKILKIGSNSKKEDFYPQEIVVAQLLRSGEAVEIYWDKNTKEFKHTDIKNETLRLYVKNVLSIKLKKIVDKYFGLNVHFYGIISKDGFRGYDIYVNSNYFDLERVNDDYKEALVKTFEIVYEGEYANFKRTKDHFIVRTKYEQPGSRAIKYT